MYLQKSGKDGGENPPAGEAASQQQKPNSKNRASSCGTCVVFAKFFTDISHQSHIDSL